MPAGSKSLKCYYRNIIIAAGGPAWWSSSTSACCWWWWSWRIVWGDLSGVNYCDRRGQVAWPKSPHTGMVPHWKHTGATSATLQARCKHAANHIYGTTLNSEHTEPTLAWCHHTEHTNCTLCTHCKFTEHTLPHCKSASAHAASWHSCHKNADTVHILAKKCSLFRCHTVFKCIVALVMSATLPHHHFRFGHSSNLLKIIFSINLNEHLISETRICFNSLEKWPAGWKNLVWPGLGSSLAKPLIGRLVISVDPFSLFCSLCCHTWPAVVVAVTN